MEIEFEFDSCALTGKIGLCTPAGPALKTTPYGADHRHVFANFNQNDSLANQFDCK